jgi:hypothetical protein
MTLKDSIKNIDYFQKLPDVVLIPWHYDIESAPPYPVCGKREIFCGPNLQNKDSSQRKFI